MADKKYRFMMNLKTGHIYMYDERLVNERPELVECRSPSEEARLRKIKYGDSAVRPVVEDTDLLNYVKAQKIEKLEKESGEDSTVINEARIKHTIQEIDEEPVPSIDDILSDIEEEETTDIVINDFDEDEDEDNTVNTRAESIARLDELFNIALKNKMGRDDLLAELSEITGTPVESFDLRKSRTNLVLDAKKIVMNKE